MLFTNWAIRKRYLFKGGGEAMSRGYDFDVDIVIPWVDSSDVKWLKEKNKYLDKENQIDVDAAMKRYRDWNNVQYVFRGIEKFAPWVRKVFFVTNGQIPNWLNKENKKLVLVNHKDYMPKEYLPTFSANPIELNVHRIEDLSEHFIYMNDDFFFLKKTRKSDFFDKKGLPKIVAMEKPKSIKDMIFDNIVMNNVRALNKIYNKQEVKRKNKRKWYKVTRPICFVMNKFYDLTTKNAWAGFYDDHLPSALLKSGIEQCWNLFYDELHNTSLNKFRSLYDVNRFLFTDYLLCSGQFYPDKYKRKGLQFQICDGKNSNVNLICKAIKKQKYKTTCLNDDNVNNFEDTKNIINNALQTILPEKSSFEV